ncbi:hypothetical protein D3C86_1311990 [compost metagenome]
MACPGHQITAIRHGGDVRFFLIACGGGVDPGFYTHFYASGIEKLCVDVARGIGFVVAIAIVGSRLPGDDVVTATQNLDDGVCLIVGHPGIDADFSARFAAVGLEPLTEDAGCIACSVTFPNHHDAAIGKAGDSRAILVVLSGGRDACFYAHLCPAGAVALQVTAPAAAVLTVRSPGHHKTAVLERGDLRTVLHAVSGCVDD